MTFHTASPKHYASIDVLNTLAFGSTAEPELITRLRKDTSAFVPELEITATSGDADTILGHIMYSRVTIGDDDILALALAPMCVHPDYQNNGIGSALLKFSIERVRELQYEVIIVLGHQHYYPRFGFSPASAFGISFPQAVPDAAFMAHFLTTPRRVDGTVRYSPAFNLDVG